MKLNYKEFGQGEPIIILHGLFGTLDNWQTIAKKLAENYSVYLLDLRNHGRSPHDDTFDYPVMAEDVRMFMEDNWIHAATVLGHSMGGKVAMQLAINYPDLIEKLIVVDIAPKVYVGGHETIFNALLGLELSTIIDRKAADLFLQSRIEDFGVRQFLLKNLTRNKAGGYQWKMNLPVIYDNYQAILGNIEGDDTCDAPTLFIRGAKSNYVADDDLSLIQTYFPNSALQTVENAGHWVHAEAPADLLGKVRAFMEA